MAREVAAAMAEWFQPGRVGNPMSPHRAGRLARKATRTAARQVATRLGVEARELTFTSGASEANHLALRGLWHHPERPPQRKRILVSAGEHPSLLEPAKELVEHGAEVEILPLDRLGQVPQKFLEEALRRDVLCVSIQAVNSETGAIQPLADFAEMIHAHGALFHSDVTQAPGRLPVDLPDWGLDLASFSAHKLGGPPGVGALWCHSEVSLTPQTLGGSQQGGRRAGSEPVALLVGMGVAYERLGPSRFQHLQELDNLLRLGLRKHEAMFLAGAPEQTAPGVVNLSFPGVDGETLLMLLDQRGVCVSNGPACSSGTRKPSPTLLSMGLEAWQISGAIRVSLGPETTPEEIQTFLKVLSDSLQQVPARSLS
jgi:cysteine desulfurase